TGPLRTIIETTTGTKGHGMDDNGKKPANGPPAAAPGQPPRPPLTPEQVFRDYAPRVYNLARRMLGNDADAEDVTQDVLLQVVRKLDTFRGESEFPTWLHRVTVNAALAHRRKRSNRQEHETHDPFEHFQEDGFHRAQVRPWEVGPETQALTKE